MASTYDAQERDARAADAPAPPGPAGDERFLRLHHRMLESGPQPFGTLDLDRRIDYANDAFCELVGYPREELVGMPIMDLTDPDFREATARSHEEALGEGRRVTIVKRYRHKDGRQVPVELLIDVSRDDEGRPLGFFAFITEISQRIQAEEALVESERRVRAIFDGIHDAVLVHDPDGRILDANPAAYRLLGYAAGELAGMDVARLDDVDFARGFRDRLDRVLAEGQLTCEGAYRTKSGRSIPVEIASSTIRFDERTAILAVIRDVTERIALERTRRRFVEVQMMSARALEAKNRELSQSEERYRRLTEGSLDAIVATDGAGRILLFNPSAEAVFGYESRVVLGEPLDLLIPALGRGGDGAGFDAGSILNKTVEMSGRRRDGAEFPIEISFGAVEADGRIEYVASIRDQTERQRMRAMLAHTDKLASIGLLSAGVAHEINNPLSYVANNLAVLRRDALGLLEMLAAAEEAVAAPADRRAEAEARMAAVSEEIDWPYIRSNLGPMIDRTLDGVRRVANIVQKMRGLARTSRPKWERASLDELIESALEMTRGRLKRDRIEVVIANHGVDCIECVPSDIAQVLLNLVINALQAVEAVEAAGQADGGHIEISARAEGPWVEIGVRDDGAGIAAEDLGRLFDPFFTTKPVGEGTGLGLAISHGIVAAHGGRIEVESGEGRGSLFRILLPRSAAGRPPASA